MLALLSSLAIAASAPAATAKPPKAPAAARPAPHPPKKVDPCAPPEKGRLLGHQFTLPKCLEPLSRPKAGA